jgi:AcrR family transcriptional regulator
VAETETRPAAGTAAPASAPPPAGPAPAGPALAGPGPAGTGPDAAGTPRRPGRPRSEQAEQAILEAALEVFAECGPDAMGIEQVAARAGVGKATIYRRWPGKEELLLDAVAALCSPLPRPQGRSVRADLTALLEALCREATDPRRARQFALLHGEGLKYPRLLARYNELVTQPRREMMAAVLRRGLATGELREGVDVDAAVYLLTGAVLARIGHARDGTDARYAQRLVEELLRGLAAR